MSLSPGQASNSDTTKTFTTALVANGALLAIEVGAFLVLKTRLERIYSPRTFLPPPDKRAENLPKSWWRWLPALISQPSLDIIHKNGLDAYMFLRFLKMLLYIFLFFTVLSFLVIIPVDMVGIAPGSDPLGRITWSNITDPNDNVRFSAHIVVVYILTFFVYYMIQREMAHFVHMRHQFLISKSHSRLAQARTVLISSVPDELANERDLRLFASFVPGGIDRVWIYRDTRAINKLYNQRQKACKMLEQAQSKVLRDATKAWRRKEIIEKKKMKDDERSLIIPPASSELLDELAPKSDRPTHRTGFLGLFGKKVDTADWCKKEIARLNEEIKEGRNQITERKFLGSVFIRCNLQMGAHVLAQCVSYHQPLMMSSKYLETNPKDIVWDNLDDSAIEVRSRYVISWLLMFGLILAWSFPVAFVGSLSNIDGLCAKVSWLAWVCKAPTPIPGIVQGVLPPVLLALLFVVLPFILYALAWYECIPRYSHMSLSVYRRFYLFLLVHGFLIVTLSSAITNTIGQVISEPTTTVQTLASQLPGASIFFLTYIVTQGLAGAGGALAQLIPLLIHFIRKWFLGRTPRQAYDVTFLMPSADFGTILPMLSLLSTITIVYSVLNPLINLLALVCFGMFFLAWKFLLTQVFDQPQKSETGGLYFPMAISNLFVGLYIEQICLACLFFLKARAAASKTPSIVEGVMMLVLVPITIAVQVLIQKSYHPITEFLPMSLATTKMAERYAKHRSMFTGILAGEEMDLFSRSNIESVRRTVSKVIPPLKPIPIPIHVPHRLDHTVGELKKKVYGAKKNLEGGRSETIETVTEDSHAEEREAKEHEREMEKEEEVKEEVTSDHSDEHTDVGSSPSPGNGGEGLESPTSPRDADRPSISENNPPASLPTNSRPIDFVDPGEDEEEIDLNIHAFDHPSTYMDQPWIWIPKDKLGLSKILVNDMMGAGVMASDSGAVMDKKGVVEAVRNPPDEEWVVGK